jgi:hypothetical protein
MPFASKMFGVPETSLPSNPEDQLCCLTAEQVRIALAEMAPSSPGFAVHVSRLRNWVVAKLHGVTRSSQQEVIDDFWRILNEGPGGTLESTGDVISAGGGFYLRTPPNAVLGSSRSAFIVSTLPSSRLRHLRQRLRMGPVGRTLVDCEVGELREFGFRVTEPRAYARIQQVPASPSDYLKSLADSEVSEPWQARPGWEPYAGSALGHGGFAFGQSARRVRVGMATVELWKATDATGYVGFWLRIEQHGAVTVLRLAPGEWRRAAFALDALHGRQREVTVSRHSDRVVLDVGFALPPGEFRLLYASGAAWRPGGSHAKYELGSEMLGIIEEIFSRCWIRTRETPA